PFDYFGGYNSKRLSSLQKNHLIAALQLIAGQSSISDNYTLLKQASPLKERLENPPTWDTPLLFTAKTDFFTNANGQYVVILAGEENNDFVKAIKALHSDQSITTNDIEYTKNGEIKGTYHGWQKVINYLTNPNYFSSPIEHFSIPKTRLNDNWHLPARLSSNIGSAAWEQKYAHMQQAKRINAVLDSLCLAKENTQIDIPTSDKVSTSAITSDELNQAEIILNLEKTRGLLASKELFDAITQDKGIRKSEQLFRTMAACLDDLLTILKRKPDFSQAELQMILYHREYYGEMIADLDKLWEIHNWLVTEVTLKHNPSIRVASRAEEGVFKSEGLDLREKSRW
ncbi:MAG: hypothetical protein ACK4M7_11010, partial [Burkholderiales bacterium]